MAKEKIFSVFGLGTFGMEICSVLSKKGAKVIAVDIDKKNVDRVRDSVTQAVLLDSTDEDALRNAALQDTDVAIISIGDNMEGSILTTILLKKIGVPYIIARAMSDVHAQVLKQIGATEVINIEVDQGQRLANRIIAPDIVDVVPISEDQVLAEMRAPENFIGKTLSQLELRKRFNVNIITVRRSKIDIDDMGNPMKKEFVFTPKPDEELKVDDVLIVLGSPKDIEKLKEI
ncbi:MAG: TrkA family potassium uptake protein [Candidatus Omnitrophica bacterium]|nr:TrkA family potassium uptake protein [Candidatus Omnitrophota bacterium]